MNKYEVMFILNPELSEEDTQSVIVKFKDLIAGSGEVENLTEWGKRRLAYLIQDFTEGYYVIIDFASNPDFPMELDRVMRINDSIIRHMITKKE
ncbi:MAG: 30S ribosomal protein S6 [Clostridia bacterium]|nr:30S ribosomal protein S6 [Clostridia bacterium]MBR6934919.1 30S ribosomal protein S6 [Clostridia bacterium]